MMSSPVKSGNGKDHAQVGGFNLDDDEQGRALLVRAGGLYALPRTAFQLSSAVYF